MRSCPPIASRSRVLLALLALAITPQVGASQSRPAGNDPRAESLIDRAVARMGGEETLRAITSIRLDMMTQWLSTTFADHPFADAPSYERNVEVRDYASNNHRNTRLFLPGTLAAVDVVRDTVGGRTLDAPNGSSIVQPLNIAYVEERRELFTFAPERTLFLAREAGGLRVLADTMIDGLTHARIATTVDGYPATWFLRESDGLLAMVRFTADETNDFGLAPWGEMEVEFWYSGWAPVKGGAFLPRQRSVRRLGVPYKRMTVLTTQVNVPNVADSFPMADSTVRAYLANEQRPMWRAPLDGSKIEAEHFATFPPFLGVSGALRVGGMWVLIETGQASGVPPMLAPWFELQTPGVRIGAGVVARTTTSNGGAAWFVRERLPLVSAPGATPMLAHIMRSPKAARAAAVVRGRWQRVGTDSLWLEPVDFPDAPGTLAVYSPTHRWLYTPFVGIPNFQPEHDALQAQLRARGMRIDWVGGVRAFHTAAPAPE